MEQKEWWKYPPGAIIIEDEEAEFRKYYFGISGGYEKQKKYEENDGYKKD